MDDQTMLIHEDPLKSPTEAMNNFSFPRVKPSPGSNRQSSPRSPRTPRSKVVSVSQIERSETQIHVECSPISPRNKHRVLSPLNRRLSLVPPNCFPTVEHVVVSTPSPSHSTISPSTRSFKKQDNNILGKLKVMKKQMETSSSSDTFMTEVELEETPPHQLDQLPKWLFKTGNHETIMDCKFPADFTEVRQLPRKRHLHPKYVIKTTLSTYFPTVFNDNTDPKQRILLDKVFMGEHNQNILMDMFWWLYITLYAEHYLQKKACLFYEVNLDKVLMKKKTTSILRKEMFKVSMTKAEQWSSARFEALKQELDVVEERIANNYAEVIVKFITHRPVYLNFKVNVNMDEMYVELMSKAIFLTFGLVFPDSFVHFETKEFQRSLTEQVHKWCYGVFELEPKYLNSIWRFKMELKLPPTQLVATTARQKFKHLVEFVQQGKHESIVKARENRRTLESVMSQLEDHEYSPAYHLSYLFHEEDLAFKEASKDNRKKQITEAILNGRSLNDKELNEYIQTDAMDEEINFELEVIKEKREKMKRTQMPDSKHIKEIAQTRPKMWYELGAGNNETIRQDATNRKAVFKTFSYSKRSSPLVSQYLTKLHQSKAAQRIQEKEQKRKEYLNEKGNRGSEKFIRETISESFSPYVSRPKSATARFTTSLNLKPYTSFTGKE